MRKLWYILIFSVIFSAGYFRAELSPDISPQLQSLKQAADDGDAKAMYRLSMAYEYSDTIPAAVDYLHRSAMAGYSPAMNYLGYCYGAGHLGLKQDSDSALWWIEQAAAAAEPDPKAFNNLGAMLLNGELGVQRDYRKARYWLIKGAEAGVPTSAAMLSKIYLQGLGQEPDTVAAMPYLRQASKAGILDATLELADIVLPDTKYLSPDSLLQIALPYFYDRITPVAIPLIERAASADVPLATAILAQCTAEGIGVIYDYNRAIELYAKAALLSEPHAQFILAETLQALPDLLEDTELYNLLVAEFLDTNDCTNTSLSESLYRCAAQAGVTNASKALQPLRPQPRR